MEIGDFENSQMVENWLLKSDINTIEGSDDIIKAICGEDVSLIFSNKSFVMLITLCPCVFRRTWTIWLKIWNRIAPSFTCVCFRWKRSSARCCLKTTQMRQITTATITSLSIIIAVSILFLFSIEYLILLRKSSIILDGSENNPTLNETESSATIHQQKEDEKADQMNENDEENQQTCDDNQNNVHNHKMVISLDNKDLDNVNNNGEKVQQNIKQILALYGKLKKQIIEYTENNQSEVEENQSRYDELSAQVTFSVFKLISIIFRKFSNLQIMHFSSSLSATSWTSDRPQVIIPSKCNSAMTWTTMWPIYVTKSPIYPSKWHVTKNWWPI